MRWTSCALLLWLCLAGGAAAQQSPQADSSSPGQSQASPKPDEDKAGSRSSDSGQSSSRDTRIDLSPPKDDAKDHPNSGGSTEGNEEGSDVKELHLFNPYRAAKDDEIGDFYFKRKNYQAALARYQEALLYKENDAVATFRMAQCYEKLGQPEEAIPQYQEYLRILPQGPFSKDARKALGKLGAPEKQASDNSAPRQATSPPE